MMYIGALIPVFIVGFIVMAILEEKKKNRK